MVVWRHLQFGSYLLCRILIIGIGLPVTQFAAEASSPLNRPNILICLADDWGWPHAGVYGDQTVSTPVFDRLAAQGVLFDRAFVSSPSCTASRNAILTGQDFYRLGEGANLWSTLDIGHPNFVQLLQNSGYEIAHYRKTWGPGDYEVGGYTQHPVGPWKRPEQFLAQRDPEKPFLYWFGAHDPHRPYEHGSGVRSGINAATIEVPGFLPDVPEVRTDLADYYHAVSRWDREVGEMLERLEQEELLQNTLVIVSGDNGMPFPRAKSNLYDYGVRVPLVIFWANGGIIHSRSEDLVSLHDLAPTILEAVGLKVPEQMTGKSLRPLLLGEETDESRSFIVFGRERHNTSQEPPSLAGYPSRAIRTRDWLLILNLEPDRWPMGIPGGATLPSGHTWDEGRFLDAGSGPTKEVLMESFNDHEGRFFYNLAFARRPAVELYHIPDDPFQLKNLAEDPAYACRVMELKARLIGYLKETGDPRFTNEPVPFDESPYRWP